MLYRTTLLALLGAAAMGLGLTPLARGHAADEKGDDGKWVPLMTINYRRMK